MPVEFLTDEEAASYGRFNGPPSRAELERAFVLDDADKAPIAQRRGDHNRLGFSLQMTTVRSLGSFLVDPLDVPNAVLEYLAAQLEIADPSCVKRYTERRTTRFEHAEEIKAALGLRDFAEAEQELIGWVERPSVDDGRRAQGRFNDAVVWLPGRGVLLPGVTTLARLVAQVRDDATRRLWTRSPPDSRPSRASGWSASSTLPKGLASRTWSADARARPSRPAGPGAGPDPGVGDHGRRPRGDGPMTSEVHLQTGFGFKKARYGRGS